ncbi:MAG: AcrR family transcriptional regulator [Rubritalea sp.]|jgi:AcrR family transcriptional regulator
MNQSVQVKGGDETKERILLAAQKLFAERGFEAVSLRKITTEALANVAAVNYHFGSKEALIDEVIVQHILPVMKERMRLLDEAERKFQAGVVPVEVILDAYMRPFLTVMVESGESRELFCKFMGRCMSERGDKIPEQALRTAQRVVKRITAMLSETLPDVEPEVLSWRLHFCFGVMAHTLMHEDTFKTLSKGMSGDPDFETTLQRMIDYCIGGLKAGSSALTTRSGGQSEFFF